MRPCNQRQISIEHSIVSLKRFIINAALLSRLNCRWNFTLMSLMFSKFKYLFIYCLKFIKTLSFRQWKYFDNLKVSHKIYIYAVFNKWTFGSFAYCVAHHLELSFSFPTTRHVSFPKGIRSWTSFNLLFKFKKWI